MLTLSATEVLTRAAARGLQLGVVDGKLVVDHADDRDLQAAELAYLRQHKPALVRELTAIRLDFETTSPLDLKANGAEVYAAHPGTEVVMLAWCIGVGPVQVWQPGERPPADLMAALVDSAGPVISHGPFDRIIWHEKLVPLGWPVVPLERWSDTSARARAYRVPAGLEKAVKRLELKHQKDPAGKPLIRRVNAAAMGSKPLTDADQAAFLDYCRRDGEVLRELDQRLPELTGTDRQMFELDAKMNQRGLPIDLDLVRQLSEVHDAENARLAKQMLRLCGLRPTQNVKLLEWLQRRAAPAPVDLQAATLESWLQYDLFGGPACAVIETRQQFAHSSGTKLKKLLASTSEDGRARGCFVWHGAHTGRWSGRGAQPQNLPRTPKDFDVDATLVALLHPSGPLVSDNGMSVKARISACLRATIAAPVGRELVVADLKQIKSRVLCWLADQQDMLKVYRSDGDPYIATAAALGSTDRQFGKLLTLAAGFGGGANMLIQKAPSYGLTFTPMEAACAISAWRAANPAITRFWDVLHGMMIQVVEAPLGRERRGHRLAVFRAKDDTLRIRLPSGRELIFHEPRMERNPEHDDRLELSYWQVLGDDWQRIWCWHGRACENVVQGVAHDILADSMLRMDAAGLDIVGTVHDEVLVLVASGQAEFTLQAMLAIMSAPPSWASDLPLAAEGYHNTRYVKPLKT